MRRSLQVRRQYRFSDHFGLRRSQAQLDFVDIPMDTDIPLFVDPYALSVSGSDWLRACGDIVVNYFDLLLKSLREKDRNRAMLLLSKLHEPNDTHLGMSRGRPSGRGWGQIQAQLLYETLSDSRAIRSGMLRDLTDIELLMPGISSDKISDLATNVIRGEFASYTEEQCRLYDVPTERISSGLYWDVDSQNWTSRYADLPLYMEERIILVPKAAVRVRLVPNYEEYYNRFVLDYFAAEHIHANDSLVTLLKNGNPKVFKRDLKNKYQLSKEFLLGFSQEHPEVLNAYKNTLPEKAKPLKSDQIEHSQTVYRQRPVEDTINAIKNIATGRETADKYHQLVLGALNEVFYPYLTRPVKEQSIDEGRKRIDILYVNSAEEGFFSRLANRHKIHCPYISVECKNFTEDPGNPELDQLQGRFSRKRGRAGILVCRRIEDKALMLRRCQDITNNTEGVIIVLEDEDIFSLLCFKSEGKEKELNDFLEEKLKAILM